MSLLPLYLEKMQRSAKERQNKPGFLSWGGCNHQGYWKCPSPPGILYEKDVMATQECPHDV